ncbi:MAG: nicotinate phosphoribosyltransferase [Gemmatimonadota bacterium]
MELVTRADLPLLTDQYELAMVQAYWKEGMFGRAVFSLFVRRLPEGRNYLLACGLDDALGYLESFRFDEDALSHLAASGRYDGDFLRWLEECRFTGDVYAVPEGTPVFADEPILEVEAWLPEGQLVETLLMNQVHLQTVLASKASRVVTAAGGRDIVDFGLRRMHGVDAGLKAARAFHVAGVSGTSNVLAGRIYGIPVVGTMAHSYVQAHDDELTAFRAFAALYPDTYLLVDTYDSIQGVRHVVRLAEELGPDFRVQGIRLDSGDLRRLSLWARKILDEAGLSDVRIFASGGLDEYEIERLLQEGAPIDGFGVGTSMGVSADAPALDIAYKLTEYAGRGRMKLSPGKRTFPGRKQVFRVERRGVARRDVLAPTGVAEPGRPLLEKVMEGGRRLPAGRRTLEDARARAKDEIAMLPAEIRALAPASRPFPVDVSADLQKLREGVIAEVQGEVAG